MKNKYSVILADPPWNFKTFSDKGLQGRPQHYERMSLKDICTLPVQDWSNRDCWIFMWTTGPHLPQAFKVIEEWGFKYSGMGFVWIKLNKNSSARDEDGGRLINTNDLFMGGGYTTRKNAEFCLIARKGSPPRIGKGVHEVIISPRREHSRKPDEVFKRIEDLAAGPYLEMFARESRTGWDSWGNETDKFDGCA